MKIMTFALAGMILAGAAHAALPPADFVKKAGASDLFEVTSAKLETSSKNPKVRAFAMSPMVARTSSAALAAADPERPAPKDAAASTFS